MRGRGWTRRALLARVRGTQERQHPYTPSRPAPLKELVDVVELEEMARIKLPGSVFAMLADGDGRPFDRMTFRPRRMVNSMKLDLTTELLGETMFAPLLVGPISEQARFHPEAEMATVRGAAQAKTTVILSSRSSQPVESIAEGSQAPLWYQVSLEGKVETIREDVRRAVEAGCKALCITVASPTGGGRQDRLDWSRIDRIRQQVTVPVLLKGILRASDARAAVDREIQGVIVSDYGGQLTGPAVSPIESLSSVVDTVEERIPVLIDGGFRRGSDILKALALGARSVLLGRPVMWGLSAYGADGVRTVLELLQSELGRSMAGAGRPNIQAISRDLLRLHTR